MSSTVLMTVKPGEGPRRGLDAGPPRPSGPMTSSRLPSRLGRGGGRIEHDRAVAAHEQQAHDDPESQDDAREADMSVDTDDGWRPEPRNYLSVAMASDRPRPPARHVPTWGPLGVVSLIRDQAGHRVDQPAAIAPMSSCAYMPAEEGRSPGSLASAARTAAPSSRKRFLLT